MAARHFSFWRTQLTKPEQDRVHKLEAELKRLGLRKREVMGEIAPIRDRAYKRVSRAVERA